MLIRRVILAVATIGLSVPTLMATTPLQQQQDSVKSSYKIVYIGRGEEPEADSVKNAISKFYLDQFHHFQDPLAPYFLLMSKDASLAMGIGGAVRMRGYFDWGGAMPTSAFIPSAINVVPDPTSRRAIGSTPAGTSLFFRVIGRNKRLGEYQLYIEANFNGYKARDFHLKKAYATINDWTVGYATSTFSDPAACPPTVDSQGPNNKYAHTAVLVRWMHPFGRRWIVAASLETPENSIGTDGTQTAKVTQYVPDAAAFCQYNFGPECHVRLAGLLRSLPYRDIRSSTNRNVFGWGVQLSTRFNIIDPLVCYAIVNGGRGTGSYGGDLSVGAYDLVADPSTPGSLYAPGSFGWIVGLQYYFAHNLFVSGAWGQNHYYPRHGVAADEYRYGVYGVVNVFWNLSPRIQAGVEFNVGERCNVDGAHRWARRLGAVCQFSF